MPEIASDDIFPGRPFGKLTAREPIKGGKFWLCDCKCGGTTRASKWHLLKNRRLSCGCRTKDKADTIVCRQCDQEKPRSEFYIRQNGNLNTQECKQCFRKDVRQSCKQRHNRLRLEALKRYGGDPPKCACCGEAYIEFLHIDHSKNDGANHRKKLKSLNLYRWLAKHSYPQDLGLRVLCANCNMSIGCYGYCPHTRSSAGSHPAGPRT
jgi:hypothetical protein